MHPLSIGAKLAFGDLVALLRGASGPPGGLVALLRGASSPPGGSSSNIEMFAACFNNTCDN